MRLSPELRARTKAFASQVIRLYVRLPRQRDEVRVVGYQMLRSGTSVAAHAREASRARSDAEFCSKVDALLQEADETELWLELLNQDCGTDSSLTKPLWDDADELIAIFTTMSERTKRTTEQCSRPNSEVLKR